MRDKSRAHLHQKIREDYSYFFYSYITYTIHRQWLIYVYTKMNIHILNCACCNKTFWACLHPEINTHARTHYHYNHKFNEYWWNGIAMWDLHIVQMNVKDTLSNANGIFYNNTIYEVEFQQYTIRVQQRRETETYNKSITYTHTHKHTPSMLI